MFANVKIVEVNVKETAARKIRCFGTEIMENSKVRAVPPPCVGFWLKFILWLFSF
jgi:hypothetical protein